MFLPFVSSSLLAAITTVDVLAVVGALCSLLMVGGSLYLLNRGIVTLKEANPEEAIKVEFQKVLSIQSRYPAIALFVVGVVFLAVSFWFYEANPVRTILVTGKAEGNDLRDAVVNFTYLLGQTNPTGDGAVREEILPQIQQIRVELLTPRHKAGTAWAIIEKDQQEVSFGLVKQGDPTEVPPTNPTEVGK
jgi:hypothetical protein